MTFEDPAYLVSGDGAEDLLLHLERGELRPHLKVAGGQQKLTLSSTSVPASSPFGGFSVEGFGFRVSGFGFQVSGIGFRVTGLGGRVPSAYPGTSCCSAP